MIHTEEELRMSSILEVASHILRAARTAPKARGVDTLTLKVVTDEELLNLSHKMREIGEGDPSKAFFVRDALSVEKSGAVLLFGARSQEMMLDCGFCGFESCSQKAELQPSAPCAFSIHDLGLAVGSAVSMAADFRIDNRVMYSAGVAAMQLSLIEGCDMVIALPIAVSGKSPFADRKAL